MAIIIHSKMFQKGPERLEKVGAADIVVGIISRNNADTVRQVAEIAGQGLRKYLRDFKPVIINVDLGSEDDTTSEFLKSDIHRTIEFLSTDANRKKGAIYDFVLQASVSLGARCCLFFSGRSVWIQPQWMWTLASPLIEEGFEYVSPLYAEPFLSTVYRDFFLYPLFYGLYGVDLRNPFPDEFALSGGKAQEILSEDAAGKSASAAGAEREKGPAEDAPLYSIALKALGHSWKMVQSRLGPREEKYEVIDRIRWDHRVQSRRFVATLKATQSLWLKKFREPASLPEGGERWTHTPEEGFVNPETLLQFFSDGLGAEKSLVAGVFSRKVRSHLERLAETPLERFTFPAGLWGDVLYELVLTASGRKSQEEKILDLLPVLLTGRIVPLLGSQYESREERIAEQARLFFEQREEFLERWDGA
jgi:hypothetical protein